MANTQELQVELLRHTACDVAKRLRGEAAELHDRAAALEAQAERLEDEAEALE